MISILLPSFSGEGEEGVASLSPSAAHVTGHIWILSLCCSIFLTVTLFTRNRYLSVVCATG